VDRQVETNVDVQIINVSTGIGFHFLYVVRTPTPIKGMQLHSSSVYFRGHVCRIYKATRAREGVAYFIFMLFGHCHYELNVL
jgi:hypothetical protein